METRIQSKTRLLEEFKQTRDEALRICKKAEIDMDKFYTFPSLHNLMFDIKCLEKDVNDSIAVGYGVQHSDFVEDWIVSHGGKPFMERRMDAQDKVG